VDLIRHTNIRLKKLLEQAQLERFGAIQSFFRKNDLTPLHEKSLRKLGSREPFTHTPAYLKTCSFHSKIVY
jgi:hypothetical protein